MLKTILFSLLVFLTVLMIMPFTADAITLVTCAPRGPDQVLNCDYCAFVATIQTTFYYILGIVFLAAVVLIAKYGLDMYFTSGDPGKVKEAFKGIMKVVVGLIIILISWVIINTIMVVLGASENWWNISC